MLTVCCAAEDSASDLSSQASGLHMTSSGLKGQTSSLKGQASGLDTRSSLGAKASGGLSQRPSDLVTRFGKRRGVKAGSFLDLLVSIQCIAFIARNTSKR